MSEHAEESTNKKENMHPTTTSEDEVDVIEEVTEDVLKEKKSIWQKMNPAEWPNFAKMSLMYVGMFTAAYDLLVINLVLLILNSENGATVLQNSLVSGACVLGTIIGQLLGGYFADYFGRVVLSRITCAIMIVGALGAGFLTFDFPTGSLLYILAIWRFVTGVGLGGEYPVGAIFTAEIVKNPKTRGSSSAAIFSAQGMGNLATSVIFFLLLLAWGEYHIQLVWRLSLAIGSIPAIIVLIPRCFLKENPNFQKKANIQDGLSQRFLMKIIITKYWKRLLGTAGSWFIFDVVFYANSLFTSQILLDLGGSIELNTIGTIVIALIALPGYWFAVFAIDITGRKPLQLFGFCGMAVTYTCVGIFYSKIKLYPVIFISLYGLSYFFANAGPNTTSYVLPSESYPRRIRSTCHGISAASGKFGAFLGSILMKPLLTYGIGIVLVLCGIISILGIIVTIFFISERKGKDFSDLEEEFTNNVAGIKTPSQATLEIKV